MDFLTQVLATVIGALTAYLVYWLQKQDQKNKTKEEGERNDLDNVAYLYSLIHQSFECVLAHKEAFESFERNLVKSMVSLPPLVLVRSTIEMDRLVNKIDHRQFYQSYQNVSRKYNLNVDLTKSYPNGIGRLSLAFSRLEDDASVLNNLSIKIERLVLGLTDAVRVIYNDIDKLIILYPESKVCEALYEARLRHYIVQSDDLLRYQTAFEQFFRDMGEISTRVPKEDFNETIESILRISKAGQAEFSSLKEFIENAGKFAKANIELCSEHLNGIKADFVELQAFVKKLQSEEPDPTRSLVFDRLQKIFRNYAG
jgi:hypothetical protein